MSPFPSPSPTPNQNAQRHLCNLQMTHEDSVELDELADFLASTTRLDVRRQALESVLGLSSSRESASLFLSKNGRLVHALCELAEVTASDRSQVFAILTNLSAFSSEISSIVLSRNSIVCIALVASVVSSPYASLAARLLANLSRHLSGRLLTLLEKEKPEWPSQVLDVVVADEAPQALFLGFVLVNLSQLPRVRHGLLHESWPRLLALLDTSKDEERRLTGLNVLRNLCFDDEAHEKLLDADDRFLTALVTPLADAEDALDEEETTKLPLRLQYFEGRRDPSTEVRQRCVEALYQLCATRLGRQRLRERGVYALLRELDRATNDKKEELPGDGQHTLHSLIGVLIRYEEEMEVPEHLHSIRELSE